MTAVAERSSCQSGDSQSSSPWDTSHKPYGYSTGCEAEPASPHDDPRQAWSVIYAKDTYQHSNLLRFLKEFCTFNPHTPCLALYEGQALRVTGEQTQILTSDRSRGTRPPLFLNDTREEIACEVGVPKDVSRLFAVRETRGSQR